MATLASFKKLGKERKKAEKEEDSKKRGKMMEKIDEKRSKTASEEIKATAKAIHSAPSQASITMTFPMNQTPRFVAMLYQVMAA